MNLTDNILTQVLADAQDKLVRAVQKKDIHGAKKALQEIVESRLPDPKMPGQRIRQFHENGTTVAWRWVVGTGTITIAAQVSNDWDSLTVWVQHGTPGMTSRSPVVFKGQGDLKNPKAVLDQAIRQIRVLGFLKPDK